MLHAAYRVYRKLGPGLLERAYREALCHALSNDGIEAEKEVPVTAHFEGLDLGVAYRADLRVNGVLLVEVKAVETVLAVHRAQLATYLQWSRCDLGVLVNFHHPRFRGAARRVVRWETSPPLDP